MVAVNGEVVMMGNSRMNKLQIMVDAEVGKWCRCQCQPIDTSSQYSPYLDKWYRILLTMTTNLLIQMLHFHLAYRGKQEAFHSQWCRTQRA